MKKDMNIQGLNLEDFWWKNHRVWSWNGEDMDYQGFIGEKRINGF
jgi:hypothetical protein